MNEQKKQVQGKTVNEDHFRSHKNFNYKTNLKKMFPVPRNLSYLGDFYTVSKETAIERLS